LGRDRRRRQMNKYFDVKDKVYHITEKYPETIDVLVANGFAPLKNEKMRKLMGKTISLEMACKSKMVNLHVLEEKLVEVIERTRFPEDETLLGTSRTLGGDIKIQGVLPCPIRIPLLENFNRWLEDNREDLGHKVDYDLKSAHIGVDWIREEIQNKEEDQLADIFISAGFDLFFDKDLFGRFKEKDVFEDLSGLESLNEDFDNQDIDLKDPERQYTVLGAVPAVFLVNVNELKGREMPKSWIDLLRPEFENSVSLPLHDFDLFNAILLTLYKNYGEKGIERLGRSLLKSMAPAEMVKSHIKKEDAKIPTVTVMPYLFTQMVGKDSPLKAIWPEDGAIISPIFLLTKRDRRKELKPLVDFFLSKEVGQLMSENGGFPSTNPKVVNTATKGKKYMWLGWDFINSNRDIGSLINECLEIFHDAKGRV